MTKRLIAVLVWILGTGIGAYAQAPLFSVSTEAVGVRLNGASSPGTDLIASFNLTKSLVLKTDNILVPAVNMDGHYGGIRYNFNLKNVIAKTNIPKDTFQPYVEGSLGIVRNSPATGSVIQRYSALLGGGFDYDPLGTGKFSFGPRVEYLSAPGFGKSPHGVMVSANLTLVIGRK